MINFTYLRRSQFYYPMIRPGAGKLARLWKTIDAGAFISEITMTETFDRILRLNSVLDRTGLSRSTLYRKMRDGSFPKQIHISVRCAGWRESAVNEWLRNPRYYFNESGAG